MRSPNVATFLAWFAAALAGSCSSGERASSEAEPQAKPSAPGGEQPPGDPFLTFATAAPAPGDVAPPFELATLDGKTVRLADAVARGPVVLVFGSFSCPPFRMKQPRFEALARRYAGKAELYL